MMLYPLYLAHPEKIHICNVKFVLFLKGALSPLQLAGTLRNACLDILQLRCSTLAFHLLEFSPTDISYMVKLFHQHLQSGDF